jgi:peptidoglycan/xylan/chitin deacetylase (PgdA/CDA1 family)
MGTPRTRAAVAVLTLAFVGAACRAEEVATPPSSIASPSVSSTLPPVPTPPAVTTAQPATTTSTSTTTSTTTTTSTLLPNIPVTTPRAPVVSATTSPAVSPAPPTTGVPAATTSTSVVTTPTDVVTDRSRSVVLDRLPGDQPVIALTFDAGSDLGHTGLILDTLSETGVTAAFGVTGEFAESHPDVVQRIAGEGHVIINHTYSHASFTGVSSTDVALSAEQRHDELTRADALVTALVGRGTIPFWRPPFGDYDTGVLDDVGAIGYRYTVMWTVDSLGWRGLSSDEIARRVVDLAAPGAIVLMHVGSQSADAQALPAVIDDLQSMGYTFVSISVAASANAPG